MQTDVRSGSVLFVSALLAPMRFGELSAALRPAIYVEISARATSFVGYENHKTDLRTNRRLCLYRRRARPGFTMTTRPRLAR